MRPEGSNPEDGDKGVELDLDDEPGALLDFLNARRRRVAKSLFQTLLGLPCRIELTVLNFLTLQLDRKLISHNVMVGDLEERVCEVFLKSSNMLEEMKKMRNDKLDLEVRLLGQLEELKKALDNISELQEEVASN